MEKGEKKMEKRTVIVTGGNSGLGYQCAKNIAMKDKDYTLDDTHNYSTLWNFGHYSIKRISPGEFSASYSFSWSEIFGCLSAMGVEIDEQYYYYPDYPYGE